MNRMERYKIKDFSENELDLNTKNLRNYCEDGLVLLENRKKGILSLYRKPLWLDTSATMDMVMLRGWTENILKNDYTHYFATLQSKTKGAGRGIEVLTITLNGSNSAEEYFEKVTEKINNTEQSILYLKNTISLKGLIACSHKETIEDAIKHLESIKKGLVSIPGEEKNYVTRDEVIARHVRSIENAKKKHPYLILTRNE